MSGQACIYRPLTDSVETRYSHTHAARRPAAPHDQPEAFLPLPASVMHIIVALAEGEKHGYAIMREVDELSGGAVGWDRARLYGSIKRMIDQGLIEETDERPDPALDDQRRRYYRLTPLGTQVGRAERRPSPSPRVDGGRPAPRPRRRGMNRGSPLSRLVLHGIPGAFRRSTATRSREASPTSARTEPQPCRCDSSGRRRRRSHRSSHEIGVRDEQPQGRCAHGWSPLP